MQYAVALATKAMQVNGMSGSYGEMLPSDMSDCQSRLPCHA